MGCGCGREEGDGQGAGETDDGDGESDGEDSRQRFGVVEYDFRLHTKGDRVAQVDIHARL